MNFYLSKKRRLTTKAMKMRRLMRLTLQPEFDNFLCSVGRVEANLEQFLSTHHIDYYVIFRYVILEDNPHGLNPRGSKV